MNSLPSHHLGLFSADNHPEPKKYSDWNTVTTMVRLNKIKEVKDSAENGIHNRHNRVDAVREICCGPSRF